MKIWRKFILFLSFLLFFSCQQKGELIEIKLLLLNSQNYLNQLVKIHGKIKEVGPLGLWFIVEDNSAYIQVTTQNIAAKMSCLEKGRIVTIYGQLEQYNIHKYFSLKDNFQCD